MLAYNLKQAGYDVLVARDGQDGLRQAQLKLPELVILDLMRDDAVMLGRRRCSAGRFTTRTTTCTFCGASTSRPNDCTG